MKIAIISSTFPPYHGGIGNIAYYNALDLQKRGHEVVVFTPKYEGKNSSIEFPFKVVRLTPWLKYGNSAMCPQLLWKLWNFKKVYLLYAFFGGAEFVWLAKFLRGKKMKLFINYQMDVVISGLLGKIIAIHRKLILPLIIKSADIVSFSSMDYGTHSDIAYLIKKYPDKFIELPNGVDLEQFKVLPKDEVLAFRKSLNILENEKVIMLCGGLDRAHYFKGVKNLIKATSHIAKHTTHNVKAIIVGEGDMKEEYQNLAKELGLENKVIFPGGVGHNELVKYYNACDIFCLPSLNKGEAFGIVIVEAMTCGKPIVASSLAGVRSVFKENEHGLRVIPKDVDDLVEKLKKLLDNDELRLKMGESAKEYIKDKYDWRMIGEKLEEYLKK